MDSCLQLFFQLHLVFVWIYVCVLLPRVFSPFFFFLSRKVWLSTHVLFMHFRFSPSALFNTDYVLFMEPTRILFKKNILKMDSTILFTHLKIILLQCFQFLVFNKISCIQTDPYTKHLQACRYFLTKLKVQSFFFYFFF